MSEDIVKDLIDTGSSGFLSVGSGGQKRQFMGIVGVQPDTANVVVVVPFEDAKDAAEIAAEIRTGLTTFTGREEGHA